MEAARNSASCFSVRPTCIGRLPTYSRRSLRVACPSAPDCETIVLSSVSTHWKPSQKRFGFSGSALGSAAAFFGGGSADGLAERERGGRGG